VVATIPLITDAASATVAVIAALDVAAAIHIPAALR